MKPKKLRGLVERIQSVDYCDCGLLKDAFNPKCSECEGKDE